MVWACVSPVERPASVCPLSMDWMAPRTISAIYAPEFTPMAMTPATSGGMRMPRASGKPK